MTEEAARELLWILRGLDRRISALEYDSEGRGGESYTKSIDDLAEFLGTANVKPTLQDPTPEAKA